MKKMMKIAAMVACVGAMFCIVGCGNSNSPESAALLSMETFLKELAGAASDVVGKENSEFLGKCKVEKSEIKGDSGVVHIAIYDKNGKKEHVEKVDVKKVNGKWVVPGAEGLSK